MAWSSSFKQGLGLASPRPLAKVVSWKPPGHFWGDPARTAHHGFQHLGSQEARGQWFGQAFWSSLAGPAHGRKELEAQG